MTTEYNTSTAEAIATIRLLVDRELKMTPNDMGRRYWLDEAIDRLNRDAEWKPLAVKALEDAQQMLMIVRLSPPVAALLDRIEIVLKRAGPTE